MKVRKFNKIKIFQTKNQKLWITTRVSSFIRNRKLDAKERKIALVCLSFRQLIWKVLQWKFPLNAYFLFLPLRGKTRSFTPEKGTRVSKLDDFLKREDARVLDASCLKRSFEDGWKDGGIRVDRTLFFFLAFDRLDRIVG